MSTHRYRTQPPAPANIELVGFGRLHGEGRAYADDDELLLNEDEPQIGCGFQVFNPAEMERRDALGRFRKMKPAPAGAPESSDMALVAN